MLPKLFQFFCVTIVTLIGSLPRAVAQDFNPQPLLDSIQVKFGGVKDYSADINIKVNVSFLKIPVKEGKLYFKNPDQLKLVSKGFAMLPKRGMNFTFNELFEKKYNVIYVKNELINKVKSYVVKIIPLDDNSDILLATLWLDRKTQTIIKVDAVSKSNGKFITLLRLQKPIFLWALRATSMPKKKLNQKTTNLNVPRLLLATATILLTGVSPMLFSKKTNITVKNECNLS